MSVRPKPVPLRADLSPTDPSGADLSRTDLSRPAPAQGGLAHAPTGRLNEANVPTMAITVEPGAVLCGHRLGRLLGKGGFGSVYHAIDMSLDRAVAFKILDRSGDGMLARFRDEAKLLARLDDPHIIRVHRVGQLPSGEAFIAMELFGDGSLDGRVERGRRMPIEEAAPIIDQVLAGLETAHDAGIVHRDIKEANILIDSASGHAKLCDFGIARAAEGDREAHTNGVILGTPYYLAPERFRGINDDPRSDIYAVGVVFYRLLTGQRPFETPGASPLVIARKAATENVPLPTHVSRAIARVCVQMIHRDPDLRYPSAAAARQALEDALLAEPTASTAQPAGGLDRPAAPRGGLRQAMFLAAAALASVLAVWLITRTPATGKTDDLIIPSAAAVSALISDKAPASSAPVDIAAPFSAAPFSAAPFRVAPVSAAPTNAPVTAAPASIVSTGEPRKPARKVRRRRPSMARTEASAAPASQAIAAPATLAPATTKRARRMDIFDEDSR
ncbi:MAG: hypothetical protein ACI9U2_000351 [Bradymonadia bacterium]